MWREEKSNFQRFLSLHLKWNTIWSCYASAVKWFLCFPCLILFPCCQQLPTLAVHKARWTTFCGLSAPKGQTAIIMLCSSIVLIISGGQKKGLARLFRFAIGACSSERTWYLQQTLHNWNWMFLLASSARDTPFSLWIWRRTEWNSHRKWQQIFKCKAQFVSGHPK